ncbi:uncharacterized protein LOC125941577 [Dermacentor silvarum]|uniref:uncharacterized protein LOC125941577 n=1 Tax=Dermacentor silvarum TaxID=543639 RepID=UPI0021013EC9|nr:uncharacterized protein LOC125941577 [Dermacentor silvarum]
MKRRPEGWQRMRLVITIGTVLLAISLFQGMCTKPNKLNLTKEVEQYVLSKRGKNLVSLNLTGGDRRPNEQPVTATVHKLQYESGCKHVQKSDYPRCKDFYIWYIYESIVTPFTLPVNLTVLYKGEKNETLPSDLNDATHVYWNPENLTTPIVYTQEYYEEKCNFIVPITFKGWFTYEVQQSVGDTPLKDALGIGNVVESSKKLTASDSLTVLYNVSGVFQHTVVCTSKKTT